MKIIVIVIACVLKTIQQQIPPTLINFQQFKQKYGIVYPTSAEDKRRQEIFNSNVTRLISDPCQTCGITKFYADTQSQIDSRLNLLLPPNIQQLAEKQAQQIKNSSESFFVSASNTILKLGSPSSLDWRDRDIMTPSKKQGDCGTCWSFATVAMCESSLILQNRAQNTILYRVDLSEQYLLKCTYGSSCSGGYLQNSIDKALTSGLPFQSQFPYSPYSAVNNGICSTKDLIPISNKSRVSKYYTDDQTIINLLVDGPIAVAISATGWQNYAGGIFKCIKNATVNHAVVIAGYNQNEWIIKNSWGTDFGDNGYIYITRDPAYNCGIGVAVHSLGQIGLGLAFVILYLFYIL